MEGVDHSFIQLLCAKPYETFIDIAGNKTSCLPARNFGFGGQDRETRENNMVHLSIHSTDLLNAYCVLGIVLGAGERTVNKTDKPYPHAADV